MGVGGETGSIWRLVSLIVFVKERLARVLVPHEVCGWKWYEFAFGVIFVGDSQDWR